MLSYILHKTGLHSQSACNVQRFAKNRTIRNCYLLLLINFIIGSIYDKETVTRSIYLERKLLLLNDSVIADRVITIKDDLKTLKVIES